MDRVGRTSGDHHFWYAQEYANERGPARPAGVHGSCQGGPLLENDFHVELWQIYFFRLFGNNLDKNEKKDEWFPLSSGPLSEFSAQTKKVSDEDQCEESETFLTWAVNPLGGTLERGNLKMGLCMSFAA